MGTLFPANQLRKPEFLRNLRTAPLVISVGDRVTESLQALGRTPDVQVIDEVERRVRRPPPEVAYVSLFRASNPAGQITEESIRSIHAAFGAEKPSRVVIDGEEDLLAIPAILAAPTHSSLYYGQPGRGVVRVIVDERAKTSAERIMNAMKREES